MNECWGKIEVETLGRKSSFTLPKLVYFLFRGDGGRHCVFLYRLGKCLYDKGYRRLSSRLFRAIRRDYGVYINPNATIGTGLKLPHPTGVVIGAGVNIGDRVTIYQQVTLGGARIGDEKNNFYPQVADDTVIFAGAKLLGRIRIGKACTIGANAVVLEDVPDYCTAVGVPAKCIMHDIPETVKVPE